MNDRIGILAEQALVSGIVIDGVYRPEGYGCHASKTFADKFAELIILECAQLVQQQQYRVMANAEYKRGHTNACDDGASIIKKHFGVE